MKMAAAEALYDTEQTCAPFSIFTIGTPRRQRGEVRDHASRACSRSSPPARFDGGVEGINDLRAQYEQKYGQDPGATYYTADGYVPIIPVTYWSFRLMIGLGHAGAALGAALVLWLTRARPRADQPLVPAGCASRCRSVPLAGNSFGWIFTEMGRQPWVVFGADDHRRRRLARASARPRRCISLIALTAALRRARGRRDRPDAAAPSEAGADAVRRAARPDIRRTRRRRRARWRSPTEETETTWSSPPSGSS